MRAMCEWRAGVLEGTLCLFDQGLDLPWGIAHCNPGMLTASKRWVWRGQCGIDSQGRLSFMDARYGVRAFTIVVVDLIETYNLKTIEHVCDTLYSSEPLIGDSCATYVATRLSIPKARNLDFDVQGRAAMRALVGFRNGVVWKGTPIHDFYTPSVYQDAVHASHLR